MRKISIGKKDYGQGDCLFRFLKDEKGVTLIEVICSIAILSIILLSFMSYFINSALFNRISSDKMTATNIAREVQKDFKVNPDKNQALNNLIIYSRTSTDTMIPKTNYPALNLTQDIQNNSGILTLISNEQNFTIIAYVDTNSDPNVDIALSKIHVQVEKGTKVLSETYTYFKNNN